MKISEVSAVALSPPRPILAEPEPPAAGPMDDYPAYRGQRSRWMWPIEGVLVQVTTDERISGLGVTIGGEPVRWIIEHHLRRFLLGQDPEDVETLWEQMFRSSLGYGRQGLTMMAISAVDLALWDLIGKIRSAPVYRLLGGPMKDQVPVYVTGNDSPTYARLGFRANKLVMPYGLADGREGMAANEALVCSAREAMGEDGQLMVDCGMGWDMDYTLQMVERLARYRIAWIEEPLFPDDLEGYARLRQAIKPLLIAMGEHEYTRFGFQRLMEAGAADILQPDVTWAGGFTEMRRICALAAAHGVPVIPHAGGVFSYHVVMSQANCPLAEYLFRAEGGRPSPMYSWLVEGEPVPEGGQVTLTEAAGFGITAPRGLRWQETV